MVARRRCGRHHTQNRWSQLADCSFPTVDVAVCRALCRPTGRSAHAHAGRRHIKALNCIITTVLAAVGTHCGAVLCAVRLIVSTRYERREYKGEMSGNRTPVRETRPDSPTPRASQRGTSSPPSLTADQRTTRPARAPGRCVHTCARVETRQQ